MNTAFTTETALFGHTSSDTARVVDDYPYGRRRTQIRYWIETSPRHGDRFVSQTLNPSTGRWNNPKSSTYMPVMAMFVDDKGHVTRTGLGTWAAEEEISAFMAVAGEHLNSLQRSQVATVIGLNRAFKGVEFVCRTGPVTDAEAAEHAEAERYLARAVAVETAKAEDELA